MLNKHIKGDHLYWYDTSLLKENVSDAFNIDFWRSQDAITGCAKGRGVTWFVQGELAEYAIRHYYRGGLLGKVINDRFLYFGEEKLRNLQELQVLKHLAEHGVNVPKPVAARVVKSCLSYQADIITQRIIGAKSLISLLSGGNVCESTLRSVGQEIRKMHDVGVNHTDLNVHNILIDNNKTVWIIDFDKCFQQSGDSWKQGNLDRLERSFLKENSQSSFTENPSIWSSIKSGYR
ncbi:3-deoxy-D-manno-octulosonic acid kinase [Vibrio cholerae]